MMSAILRGWRADVLNRGRKRSYLVMLLGLSLLTLFFFPVTDANYQTLEIQGYRGLYDSNWMGAALAILEVMFLPIICFYLVKNAVTRDRNGGVGELIAATPVSKAAYLGGKWLANLTLLCGMALVMLVTTALAQLWIGEDYHLQLTALLLPQLIFVLPVLALIAGFTLLFEMLPWLRGGFGNIAYFFLWVGLIANTMEGGAGIGEIMQQMENAVTAFDPASAELTTSAGVSIDTEQLPLKTFIWQGLDYNATLWTAMLKMSLLALVIFLISPLFFDRFSRQGVEKEQRGRRMFFSVQRARIGHRINAWLCKITEFSTVLTMIRLEFMLMVKGRPWWLLAALPVLAVAQLVVESELVLEALVPASLLLCVLMLSPLGQREKNQHTEMLVFSCPSPLRLQLIAMTGAGLLLLLFATSGALLRFASGGDWMALGSLVVGLVFTVMLAICCGTWTRTSRTFEILFTFLWYIGPLQNGSLVDFIGRDPEFSATHSLPWAYLVLSALLAVLAVAGRKLQVAGTAR